MWINKGEVYSNLHILSMSLLNHKLHNLALQIIGISDLFNLRFTGFIAAIIGSAGFISTPSKAAV